MSWGEGGLICQGGLASHMIHKLQHCTKLPTTAIGPLPLLATAVNHQQMLRFSNTGSVFVLAALEIMLWAQPEHTIWAVYKSFDHASVCSLTCLFLSSFSYASAHLLVGLFVHSIVSSGWESKVVLLSDLPCFTLLQLQSCLHAALQLFAAPSICLFISGSGTAQDCTRRPQATSTRVDKHKG